MIRLRSRVKHDPYRAFKHDIYELIRSVLVQDLIPPEHFFLVPKHLFILQFLIIEAAKKRPTPPQKVDLLWSDGHLSITDDFSELDGVYFDYFCGVAVGDGRTVTCHSGVFFKAVELVGVKYFVFA